MKTNEKKGAKRGKKTQTAQDISEITCKTKENKKQNKQKTTKQKTKTKQNATNPKQNKKEVLQAMG